MSRWRDDELSPTNRSWSGSSVLTFSRHTRRIDLSFEFAGGPDHPNGIDDFWTLQLLDYLSYEETKLLSNYSPRRAAF
jgi:hypothetical protein